MKRPASLALLTAALAITLWVRAPAATGAGKLFAEIDDIFKELSGITGLKPLKPVRSDTMTREALKSFLEERIAEVVKPEEIRAEELTLKKFGFVPADFDLKATTIDLMTEQAAAFYDYKKKRLFLLDSAPPAMLRPALVHELAHALADQHFNLEKFIQRGKSDDSSLARMAVMEGQATWLMSEHMMQESGASMLSSPAADDMMRRMTGGAPGEFPVFDNSPLYMRETLMFPYTAGIVFQQAVVKKLGTPAFAEVFRNPPASTQQILHPDVYFAGTKPSEPKLPQLSALRGFRTLADGALGELDHSILLRQYAGEAEAARVAAKWKGGRYRVLEHKQDRRTVLMHASEWQDEDSAREYFRLYGKILEGKWKSMNVTVNRADSFAGEGDDGYFLVRLQRNRVTAVEGMAEPLSNDGKD